MSKGSPYREAEELGPLEREHRGTFNGRLLFGIICVAIVVLVIVFWSGSMLVSFGSFGAIAADAAKGGDSKVLLAPLLLLFCAALCWFVGRTFKSVKHERVRFCERGLEVVDRRGLPKRCRYEEIDDVLFVRNRGRVVGATVKLTNGGTFRLGYWFDLLTIRDEIVARIHEAKRKLR